MSFPQWHQSDFKRECLSCQIPGTQGMARGLRAQPTALQQDPRGPARGKTCFKSIHPLTFSCSPVLVFSCLCSHVLSWQEARLASNPYTLILLRRAHGLPNHSFIPNTKYSLHTCSGNRRREASLQQDPLLAVEKQRDARDQRWRAPPRGAPRAPPRGAPRTNTWEIVRCCWPKPPWR